MNTFYRDNYYVCFYLNNRNGPIYPTKTDNEKQEIKKATNKTKRARLLAIATFRTAGRLKDFFLSCS